MEQKNLILGFDFGEKYSQFCCYDRGTHTAVSIPVKEGEEKVTLQIGTGTAQELIPDPQFKDSLYSYKFTEDTTQQTVFTVKDPKGNTYHFFWTDLDCNLLQVTDNIANVTGEV